MTDRNDKDEYCNHEWGFRAPDTIASDYLEGTVKCRECGKIGGYRVDMYDVVSAIEEAFYNCTIDVDIETEEEEFDD